jgi:hypothetical protein
MAKDGEGGGLVEGGGPEAVKEHVRRGTYHRSQSSNIEVHRLLSHPSILGLWVPRGARAAVLSILEPGRDWPRSTLEDNRGIEEDRLSSAATAY